MVGPRQGVGPGRPCPGSGAGAGPSAICWAVLHRLACCLSRGRKQRADIDVEAQIGEGRRDYFLTAVVAVLADLGDQDARAAAFVMLEP